MALRPISDIADDLGLRPDERVVRRPGVLKVPVKSVRDRVRPSRRGKLVLVTAMTPTPHGEGKTVTTIGLSMGLHRLGKKSVLCLRQPSLGPVFGIKGGAAGAGRSTVEPSTAINLGFTGDADAVASSHNLLAALIDNHIFHGNAIGINPERVFWPRTLDCEDRALRNVRVGLEEVKASVPRSSGFIIAAASEMMAVLGLAKDYPDLKRRLGRIVVAERKDGSPVRADDLKGTGSLAALMRDALEPNLVQTAEGTPALVHGGPFGNIAHGTASRMSIDLALYSADYALVEVGFGSDLGCEKFVDLLAPYSDLSADAAVIVATVKALRFHGGEGVSGETDRLKLLRVGLDNLLQHVENVKRFGLPAVIALNKFADDTPEEIAEVRAFGATHGVPVEISEAFTQGGKGTEALADRVIELAARGHHSHPLYAPGTPIPVALDQVVMGAYGGDGATLTATAQEDLARLTRWGETDGPVCIAKTALSLSDDPKVRGRPKGFRLKIDRLIRSAGAEFTVAQVGRISLMPGLPSVPAAERISLDDDGTIRGVL